MRLFSAVPLKMLVNRHQESDKVLPGYLVTTV